MGHNKNLKGELMFEILVTAVDEVQGQVDAGWPTKIISVINKKMPDYGPHHLHLVFDDVHRTDSAHIVPLEEHLHQIFEFTKDLKDDDRVLVHCLAGISRSTATAIGILIQHGMSYEDAYNHIASIRKQLAPNKLLISYIDDHFGLGGKLLELVKEKDPYPHLVMLATKAMDGLNQRVEDEKKD